MNLDLDDLDCAMGELANLFAQANQVGVFPHLLNPHLFYRCWTVLSLQPFPLNLRCRQTLLSMLTEPYWKTYSNGTIIRLSSTAKRYENTFTY